MKHLKKESHRIPFLGVIICISALTFASAKYPMPLEEEVEDLKLVVFQLHQDMNALQHKYKVMSKTLDNLSQNRHRRW